MELAGDRFAVRGPSGGVADLELGLAGRFQRDNAVVAVVAAQLLGEQGWPVPTEAIRRGLLDVEWPGRFQTVLRDPLTIVDGADNPTSARALAETIRERLPNRPIKLVIGMADTKDVEGTLAELAPCLDRIVVTRASYRATDPGLLTRAAESLSLPTEVADSPAEAVM